MTLTTFLYTLKVWLSAVFAAPVLLFIGASINMRFGQMQLSKMFTTSAEMYQMFIMIGGILSFPTWLIFLVVVMIAMKSSDSPKRRKYIVAILAVLLAAGTFAVVGLSGFSTIPGFSFLMVSYTVCIAAGSLYYKLEAEETPELEISLFEQ